MRVSTQEPEAGRCERPDREEDGSQCRETVGQSDGRGPWQRNDVHQPCDGQTDDGQHPAEEQREVGVEFPGHDRSIGTGLNKWVGASRTVASGRYLSGPDRYARRSIGPQAGFRAQANLVALVAALVALTTAMVVGFAVADSALVGSVREPDERHAASAVAAGMVDADAPLTNRTNVLNGSAVDALTVAGLRARYPVLDDRSFRVALDDETIVSNGTVRDGSTVRRIVLVERTRRSTVTPRFTGENAATLPRRTARATLTISPPENRSVSTVRADGRTVLHAPDGRLDGTYTVSLSRRETVRLTFVANGSLERGDVTVTMYPRETRKAVLAVTVDG